MMTQNRLKDFRIVFMGTPDFAVQSLQTLIKAGYNIVCVVTAPDKPSGRGRKILPSPVKQCAQDHGIPLLQPEKLKDPGFIKDLEESKPDLIVVVAFRMLPEVVWKLPSSGTINLHASLLPQYRGAAPINWAIINGEKHTGITTFFIRQEMDTGNIILQEKVEIAPDETAGELHDRLMIAGAGLVEKTVDMIASGTVTTTDQQSMIAEGTELKKAPKIFTEDCRIKWHDIADHIYNFIRGLSPYPGAWSEWKKPDGDTLFLKIFSATREIVSPAHPPGTIITDYKSHLEVAAKDGYISIENLQQSGKKRMDIAEFLRGIKDLEGFVVPGS